MIVVSLPKLIVKKQVFWPSNVLTKNTISFQLLSVLIFLIWPIVSVSVDNITLTLSLIKLWVFKYKLTLTKLELAIWKVEVFAVW